MSNIEWLVCIGCVVVLVTAVYVAVAPHKHMYELVSYTDKAVLKCRFCQQTETTTTFLRTVHFLGMLPRQVAFCNSSTKIVGPIELLSDRIDCFDDESTAKHFF